MPLQSRMGRTHWRIGGGGIHLGFGITRFEFALAATYFLLPHLFLSPSNA
jgi:hypothetical protein